jgi:demethylmenaquinone methyltransferase/2-methoxy-6-polyprenyl-1,4-benzoquinol methylase
MGVTAVKEREPNVATPQQPKLLGESTVDWRDANKGRAVRSMFAGIARRYDLLNHLLTFNLDRAWRRSTVKLAGTQRGMSVLDVCCGTGDLAFAFARAVGPEGRVTGSDFTPEMLTIARAKGGKLRHGRSALAPAAVPFLAGDTLHLPFPDANFDICSTGFGIRNVQDIPAGIREMMRVVKPGGRVVILECTQPKGKLFARMLRFYMTRFVPWLGQKLSRSKEKAYSYLPDSVAQFPGAAEFAKLMEAQGLREVTYRYRAFGIVAIHVGTKPK